MVRIAHIVELAFVAATEEVFSQKVFPGHGISATRTEPHTYDAFLTTYGRGLVTAMLEIDGIDSIVIEEGYIEEPEPHGHFYQFKFKINPASINDRSNILQQILTCLDALSIAACG